MKAATLAAALLAATEVQAERFFESLQRQDVTFQIESPTNGLINPVTVKVQTNERSRAPVTTGGHRQIEYRLMSDETGWRLRQSSHSPDPR